MLVDMPGYGYAAASKTKAAAWSRLVQGYLHGRVNLARVYLLVDSRHGLKPADEAILDTLSHAAVSHQVVLTKCDEMGEAALAQRAATVKTAIGKRPAAYPELIATSARHGQGIEWLRAAIARLLAERGSLGLPHTSLADSHRNN
jgi:GTP-binding protein